MTTNSSRFQKRRRRAAALAAMAALASGPVLAQTGQPDAGQTLRQLQQQPAPSAPTARPTLTLPPETDTGADASVRFRIASVQIEGNSLISSAELRPLVDPLAGRDASLAEVREAAARITALYRARGYIVARAYVPAQELTGGVLRIAIIEGKLTSSKVDNGSLVGTPVLEGFVASQALGGKPIRSAALDRELLLIADLPGVGAVNGVLRPGQEVGSSDLTIAAGPGKAREGDVSIDNYGNRYTGQARLNGRLDINSPAGLGDRLSLRATYTEEQLLYGRAAWDLPVGGDGWRVGANLSTSRYDLGREFANLDADGTAHTGGLYASYPLLRGLNRNVWLRGALDYRKLKDTIRVTDTESRKKIKAATFEAYGDLTDAVGGGAYSTWRLGAVLGKLDIDSPDALAADQAGPRADGSYRKVEYGVTRLQALAPRTTAFVSLAGQWAGQNLDSSEKFVLGGAYGVRAYPQGEGVGDDAWLANIELRQDLAAGVQLGVFYDHGHVKFNHDRYADGANTATLKGAGVNLAVKYRSVDVKATLAWRTGERAVTAPDRTPRLWLMASHNF